MTPGKIYKSSDGIVDRRQVIRLFSDTANPEAFPKIIRPILSLEARIVGFFILSFFAMVAVFPLLSAFEAHVVNVTAQIEPNPGSQMCDVHTLEYWDLHEGCALGTGQSIWTHQVNELSAEFSSVFASTTATEICQFIHTLNCPFGSSKAARYCQGRADLLNVELNIASGHLQMGAFIAGAYDGTGPFTELGLSQVSTVQEMLVALEGVFANPDATGVDYVHAGHVAKRLIEFYDEENPFYPFCVFNVDDIPKCMNLPHRVKIININSATVINSITTNTNTGGNSANGGSGGNGGTIITGNASSSVNLINIINTNITNLTCGTCCPSNPCSATSTKTTGTISTTSPLLMNIPTITSPLITPSMPTLLKPTLGQPLMGSTTLR